MIELVPLYALVAPFLLWPIEYFFPYPYIVEEIAKAFVLAPFFNHSHNRYKLALISGIVFALSESVLFFFNIMQVGQLTTFFTRFLATSLLHSTTSLIIVFGGSRSFKFLLSSLLLSGTIHFLYNNLITSF